MMSEWQSVVGTKPVLSGLQLLVDLALSIMKFVLNAATDTLSDSQ